MSSPIPLVEAAKNLPDPRNVKNRVHELPDMLAVSICAVLCGAEGFRDIELFGKCNEEWLRSFLHLPKGIPSHDTFNRLFRMLKHEAFSDFFYKWTSSITKLLDREVVSLDGKRLRNSHSSLGPLTMVSAWASENGLSLGSKIVDGSESTSLPAFIAQLYLKGCIITIDAAGCYKPIVEQIVEQKADYVIALKRNQPSLYNAVETCFDEYDSNFPIPCKEYQTNEKSHGRTHFRRYTSIDSQDALELEQIWPGMKSIGRVESVCFREGKEQVEVRYFISSLPHSAINLEYAVRCHWHIENRFHWLLDVHFNEDKQHLRRDQVAQNMAVLRRLTLNLLKKVEDTASFKARRKKCGWDKSYLLKVLRS